MVRPKLVEEFGYTNPMQVPKLEKIVINMGVGEAAGDQKKLDAAVAELTAIAGQKPVRTMAKKAIAGFKIREGQPIGCKVTLRKARMYEFLDRLVTIAMPRVRDFRGMPANKGFDGRGNFAMGMKEQIVFPEINYDRVDTVRGMDIQFVTTAKTDKEAKALLKAFQLPFASPELLEDRPRHRRGSRFRRIRPDGQDFAVRTNKRRAKLMASVTSREARHAEGRRDGPHACRWRIASTRP